VFPFPAGSEEPKEPAAECCSLPEPLCGSAWADLELGGGWDHSGQVINVPPPANGQLDGQFELPWQPYSRPSGWTHLTLLVSLPNSVLTVSGEQLCSASTVDPLCTRIQSMRQARIRPKSLQNCSQGGHPPQPSHSRTEL